MSLQVDAIADFVCPWCYLGKRRLELALENLGGEVPQVSWHPFRLNPDLPADGMPIDEYFDKRFGGRQLIQPMLDQLTEIGRKEGIVFRFESLSQVPNTLNAHRLIQIAGPGDIQNRLVGRLFSGFFEQGLNIGRPEVLEVIARDAGVDDKALKAFLDDGAGVDGVTAEEEHIRKLGVVGVPNYILNGRYSVAGAQEPETLVRVFDRVLFSAGDDDEALPAILH